MGLAPIFASNFQQQALIYRGYAQSWAVHIQSKTRSPEGILDAWIEVLRLRQQKWKRLWAPDWHWLSKTFRRFYFCHLWKRMKLFGLLASLFLHVGMQRQSRKGSRKRISELKVQRSCQPTGSDGPSSWRTFHKYCSGEFLEAWYYRTCCRNDSI